MNWSELESFGLENDIGIDIGGTLTKMVYFQPWVSTEESREHNNRVMKVLLSSSTFGETGRLDDKLRIELPAHGGTLHFIKFETRRIPAFFEFIKGQNLIPSRPCMYATGGGAAKFEELFKTHLGMSLIRFDELESLVQGIRFLVEYDATECYYWKDAIAGPSASQKITVVRKRSASVCTSSLNPSPSPSPSPSSPSSSSSPAPFSSSPASPLKSSSSSYTSSSFASYKISKKSSVSRVRETQFLFEEESTSTPTRPSSNVSSLTAALNSSINSSTSPSPSPSPSPTPPSSSSSLFLTSSRRWKEDACDALYPFMIVNIGSGVSILKVESKEKFSRLGGTSLGGSTFFGICSLLTGCQSFAEALALAAKGDSTKIDMTIEDIYGCDYVTNHINLPTNAVAASFGKMVKPDARKNASKEDLARACLVTVTNNIGSIAHLHAQVNGIPRIIFAGSFLVGNDICMKSLAYAMEFWSQGKIKALFLHHEGYAGAVGSLLKALSENAEKLSASGLGENLLSSSY